MAADGKLVIGTGMTMEAIEQNPIVYELAIYRNWCRRHANPIRRVGVRKYARRRYGPDFDAGAARGAWELLTKHGTSAVYESDFS